MNDVWTPQDGQPVAAEELVAHAPQAWALACSFVHPTMRELVPCAREMLASVFLFVAASGQGMDTASKIVGALFTAPVDLFWGLSLGGATEVDDEQKQVTLGALLLNLPIKLLRARAGEDAVRAVATLLWAQLSEVPGCSARDTQRDPEASLTRAMTAWAEQANTAPLTAWVSQDGEA